MRAVRSSEGRPGELNGLAHMRLRLQNGAHLLTAPDSNGGLLASWLDVSRLDDVPKSRKASGFESPFDRIGIKR